ncbi:hypothetical protein [Ulvibacter antarcticus]|uniref:Long-subunit fatty acid transport protein n=1 Tax=Ulvibacter antarcticus TaxID=442714 RepID=A0A3L9Z857_9FLAO|nr:hypothetical protein [Ulvibacter antarcticus]RMA66475.1 hypothetical protein BXY75_0901 [Ulvibacter antarcticus]
MLKRIIIGVLIFVSGISLAQEGTTSPYSFYGIGIQKFKGTAENRSMSGIGMLSDSIHLNLQNPASIADLRLVNYSVGGSHKYVTQKNASESQKTSTTSLDYIAIGIPMGKLGASFGLIPYSAVGYKLQSVGEGVITQSSGEGGLNRAFLTFAYTIMPGLNIGVETNYNFGNIQNAVYTKVDEVELGTRVISRSDIRGFSFNLGATYKTMVTDNLELSSAINYTPGTNFVSENSREISSIAVLPSGLLVPSQFIDITDPNSDFTYPSQITLGAGIGQPKNWFAGLEYTNQKTSNFTNRQILSDPNQSNVNYVNASKFKLGGYYIPNYNAIGNYWKRIIFRAGVRMEETGINIEGQDINEFGISFGVGLPAGRLFSNINLGFELGKRGTTDFGLIQENFFNTFLSLSLNDRWFEKRYYD